MNYVCVNGHLVAWTPMTCQHLNILLIGHSASTPSHHDHTLISHFINQHLMKKT